MDKPTITIKLKPWLQEYLRCKLADQESASRKNIVGALLTPYLEYTPKDFKFIKREGLEYISFKLPNLIGDKDIACNNVYISDANQKNFERVLDIIFKDQFYSYMEDKIRYIETITGKKGAIKICIEQFCMDLNITYNHINYEMLKKSYYRKRNNGKKSLKHLIKQSLSSPLIFLM